MSIKDYEKVFEEGKNQVCAELFEGYSAYDFEDQSVTLKDVNSRYKVASALQKAIRRGHVKLAERYAQAIYNSAEQDYVWYRLPIIGFEDVGVANLPALAQVCHAGRFKTIRNKYDGLKLCSYLANILASGVKCRVFTEAVVITSETNRAIDDSMTLDTLTELELRVGGAKNAYNWFTREKAPNYIKSLTEGLYTRKELYQYMLENLGNIPKEQQAHFKYAFVCGTKMSVETLNTAMPYILSLLKPEDLLNPQVITTDTSEYTLVGGVPDYAWDYHVREGGVAYRKFLYFVRAKLGWEVPLPVLKEALFLTNISVLDKELVFPKSQEIKMDSYKNYLEWCGLSPAEFDDFISTLESDEFQDKLLEIKIRSVEA